MTLANLKLQNSLHGLKLTKDAFEDLEKLTKKAIDNKICDRTKDFRGYQSVYIITKYKVKYQGKEVNIYIPISDMEDARAKKQKKTTKKADYVYQIGLDGTKTYGDALGYHGKIDLGIYNQKILIDLDASDEDLKLLKLARDVFYDTYSRFLSSNSTKIFSSAAFKKALDRELKSGTIFKSARGSYHVNVHGTHFFSNLFEVLGMQDKLKELNRGIEKVKNLDPDKFNKYLLKVISVIELPEYNRRLALLGARSHEVRDFNRSSTSYSRAVYVDCITSDESLYNYLDEGRDLYYHNICSKISAKYYQANQIPSLTSPDLVFLEEGSKIPDRPESLIDVARKIPGNLKAATNADLEQSLATILIEEARKQRAAQRLSTRAKALKDRVSTITETIPVILNDMKFYSDRIEYQDQVFKTSLKTCKSMLKELLSIYGESRLIFDNFFAYFISTIEEKTKEKKAKSENTIGNVEANFEIKGKSDLYYINDIRVNKGELSAAFRQALCYDKQDQFNAFLKAVSKCSLFLHNILANGITLDLHNEWENTILTVKLNIVREKNKNFIKLGKTNYPIKNVRTLKNKQEKTRSEYIGGKYISYNLTVDDFMTLLGSSNMANITNVAVFKQILKEGQESYKNAIEKSKKLLESTEKTLKLTEVTKAVQGRNRSGYVITGVSGKQYFVDSGDDSRGAHNSHYPVFTWPEGHPICIVDKTSTVHQPGKDALVNRLFALKNDKFVAREIGTLRV